LYINPNEIKRPRPAATEQEELLELQEEVLRRLSVKLLYDLTEAQERLRQTSRNSSRPASSDLPWDKAGINDEDSRQQPGHDACVALDEQPLDTEKAPKTEPEEKTQDEERDTANAGAGR